MKYTPISNPNRFLHYGSNAYRLLCYGRFRRNKPFTSDDYRNFVLNEISTKRLDESFHALVRCGYLEKHRLENAIRTNDDGYVKFVYKITLSGHNALLVLGSKQRQKEEKLQKQHNYNNGLTRWNKHKKELKFLIQNK